MSWFAQTSILKMSIVVALVGIVSLLAALAYINQGALCNIVKNNMQGRILMTAHASGDESSSSKDPAPKFEYSPVSDSSSCDEQSEGTKRDSEDMTTDSEGSAGYSEGSKRDSEYIQTDSEDIQTDSKGCEKREKTPLVQPGSSKEEIETPLVTMRSNAREINALRKNITKPPCDKYIPSTDESTAKDQSLKHPNPIQQKSIENQLKSISDFNLEDFSMDVVLLKNKEAELSDLQKKLDNAFLKYSEDKSILDDVIRYSRKAGSIANIDGWLEKKINELYAKAPKVKKKIDKTKRNANARLLRHNELKKMLDSEKPKEVTASEKICSSQENIMYDLKTEKLELYDNTIKIVDMDIDLNNIKIEYAIFVINKETIVYELILEKIKKISEKKGRLDKSLLLTNVKSACYAAQSAYLKSLLKKQQALIEDMKEFILYTSSIISQQIKYKEKANEIRSTIIQMQKLQEIERKQRFKWAPVYEKYTQENTKAIIAYSSDVDLPTELKNLDPVYKKAKNDIASMRRQYDKYAIAMQNDITEDYLKIQTYKEIVEERWIIYSNKKEKHLKLSWCVKKLKDNNIKMHGMIRKLDESIEKNKSEYLNYTKEHKVAVDGLYNHWIAQELSYQREEKNCNNQNTSNQFLLISSKIDDILKKRNNIDKDRINMIKTSKITVDMLYKDHPSYKDYLNYIKAIATYDKNIAELDLDYMDGLKSKTKIAILIKEKYAARAINNAEPDYMDKYFSTAYKNHINYIETCMDYIKDRCDYLRIYIDRLNDILKDNNPPLFIYMYTEATMKQEVDAEKNVLYTLIQALKDKLEGK
ncbi:hypothetical protein NEAUS03_1855 [Nematocida ausubeli]|nr:hypothetical protein NEAUS03_1855 [Nematocida ausubeli]